MPERVAVLVNGVRVEVPCGATVAVAILIADQLTFRHSVLGEARAPLCGMGICFECRVTIDGRPNTRSCQMLVREGMTVWTT
jgi:sarcosine oxidase subunit alpha